jgi:hypothetical protein
MKGYSDSGNSSRTFLPLFSLSISIPSILSPSPLPGHSRGGGNRNQGRSGYNDRDRDQDYGQDRGQNRSPLPSISFSLSSLLFSSSDYSHREKFFGVIIVSKDTFGFICPYSGEDHIFFSFRDGPLHLSIALSLTVA